MALPFALSVAAEPDPTPRSFSIKPQPVADALLDFALQAGITIGGVGTCSGSTPGLQGRFTLDEGLRRLLAGSQCRFEFADPRTVRMTAAPAPSAPPVKAASLPAPPPSEEILVQSSKRGSETADRLPDALSVISAAQLGGTHDVDTADTVARIAGMSMTNLGPGRDKIMLRGLSDGTFTGRTQSTVGTYLDGLPVNYNAPDPDLKLYDVDRVEVMRGPQGALYGSGSLSGIFRIVTRKPDLGAYGADLSADYGWTEGASTSRSASAMVNLPLAEDVAALRVVAYGDLDGGYLNNGNLRQSDVDRTVRDGGRAALEVKLGDDWTITAASALQALNSADSQYTVGPQPRNRANRVGEANKNDFVQGSLTVSGSFGWGGIESSTGYVHHSYSNRYDASAALSLFDDDNSQDIGIFDERSSSNLLIEDLVATSSYAGPLQWLAGLYAARTEERGGAELSSHGTGAASPLQLRYQVDRHDRLNEAAPYGEVIYDLGAGWEVRAGARLFYAQLDMGSDVLSFPGRMRSIRQDGHYRGWAPKVSLQHEFTAEDMVYATYSEGYRPGGFNSGGIAAPTAAQQLFDPDRLRNTELGVKSRAADGFYEIRSALFYEFWSDIQTDQYLASGLSYTTNVGDARVWGWETEAVLRPTSGLTLGIDGLLDSARLSNIPPSITNPVTSGLPGVATASFGATAEYEFRLDEDFSLLFAGKAAYVGRSRLTFQPALSQVMGGYITGRLSAGLGTAGWRLLAVLDNPADVQGDTFAFGNPFSFGQVRQITPLRPRTLTLVLSAHF